MCRLMLFGPGSFSSGNEMYNVMQKLEKSLGGHGNGIVMSHKGKELISLKGIPNKIRHNYADIEKNDTRVSLKQITTWSYPRICESTFTTFHTRMASVGNISNDNCQPLRTDKTFLLHNGHLGDLPERLAIYRGMKISEDNSDTKILFNLIHYRALTWQIAFLKKVLRPTNDVLIFGSSKRVYIYATKQFYFSKKLNLFCSETLPRLTDDWCGFTGIHKAFDNGKWRFPAKFTKAIAYVKPTYTNYNYYDKGYTSADPYNQSKTGSELVAYSAKPGKETKDNKGSCVFYTKEEILNRMEKAISWTELEYWEEELMKKGS